METAIIVILAALCAILLIDLFSLERGLHRGKEQIREQIEGKSTARLTTPCPNAAAEELLEAVNDLLELRQAEGADYRRKEQDLRRQIADVSHDLRTPLTSILGYLQLLGGDSLPPAKRAEYLEVMRSRAAMLLPDTVRKPPPPFHPRSHSSTTPVNTVSPSSAAVKVTASASGSSPWDSHKQVSRKLSQGVPRP